MDFLELHRKIQFIIDNFDRIIIETLEENETFIKSLIQGQLKKGQKKSGNITPKYSNPYAKKKGFTTPDLFDTGEFYNNIFTNAVAGVIEVDSIRKNKGFNVAENLEERYGSEIYELNEKSIEDLRAHIIPQIQLKIRKAL